jgi:hypothetical protein
MLEEAGRIIDLRWWNSANGDGMQDLVQSRAHNMANEIIDLTAAIDQPLWITPTYDRVGNMISGPKPGNETKRHHYVYDAWNRMVTVKESNNEGNPSGTISEYRYDGRHFRIVRDNRHIYYSSQGQVLEDRFSMYGWVGFSGADTRYIWGLRYIDDLVCRDQVSSQNPNAMRIYAIQDANWNVTGLAYGGNYCPGNKN